MAGSRLRARRFRYLKTIGPFSKPTALEQSLPMASYRQSSLGFLAVYGYAARCPDARGCVQEGKAPWLQYAQFSKNRSSPRTDGIRDRLARRRNGSLRTRETASGLLDPIFGELRVPLLTVPVPTTI